MIDRQREMMLARGVLQEVLKRTPKESWAIAAKNFVQGINIEFRKMGIAPTDLAHLLPSFSSDSTLITFADVMKCYDN